MNDRRKRKIVMYGLMIAVMITTVAYAILQTSLNINGTVTKKGGKWNIYFDNPQIITESGDAELTLPDSFPTNTTTFDFNVVVVKPADSVAFKVDVVNDGTLDAVLDSITLSGVNEAKNQDVIFTVTYEDGTPIKKGDSLAKETSRTLKITVTYDEEATTLASEDVVLNLGTTLIYAQTVEGGTLAGEPDEIPELTSVTLTDLYNAGKIDNNVGVNDMSMGPDSNMQLPNVTITFDSYAKVTIDKPGIDIVLELYAVMQDGSRHGLVKENVSTNSEQVSLDWAYYIDGTLVEIINDKVVFEGNIATLHVKIDSLNGITFEEILIPA